MLSTKILHKLAEKISNELTGEWLIFGGSSLYLLGIDSRATLDVDIAPFESSTNADMLKLMDIAVELKLPVETINQAGAFFLNKIENWQGRCKIFCKGKQGKIYIPELDLYIELKSSRLNESDFSDCISYLNYTKKMKINFDKENINKILRKAQVKANSEHKQRLAQLIKKINAS